ncbi:polymorphic toxin type 10 domain-containing protein [Pannonibacter phragmitetus]|nr:polymorphic toxin type 10 domain-containing protein [Pannonibacter phragmitetus]
MFRGNSGFAGGEVAVGDASEFVVPNDSVPVDAIIRMAQ